MQVDEEKERKKRRRKMSFVVKHKILSFWSSWYWHNISMVGNFPVSFRQKKKKRVTVEEEEEEEWRWWEKLSAS